MDSRSLPGGDLVEKGISDLADGLETVEALLVSVNIELASPRGHRSCIGARQPPGTAR